MSRRDAPVNVVDRIKDILGDEWYITADDTVRYTWNHGYENLDIEHDGEKGGLHFAGAHHPIDSLCHANNDDNPNGSSGGCIHCGRTLF